jgi:sigma-B regulation protein RsbU (phosphoserine phosphatase)
VRPVGATGTLVGVLSQLRVQDSVLRLDPGDLLVMYTDGVTEGRRAAEFFGEERLHRSVVEHRDARLPADGILGDVLDFQQGSARDDIAVVAVRVPPLPATVHQQVREESPT